MCTKIQDFACKIPKFFRGLYPRTPSAGGGDPLPHPPPAWLRHARRRSAPRLRGPRPPLILQHPPKFKILYNTLVSKGKPKWTIKKENNEVSDEQDNGSTEPQKRSTTVPPSSCSRILPASSDVIHPAPISLDGCRGDISKMRGGADLRGGLKTYTFRFLDILRFTNTDVGVPHFRIMLACVLGYVIPIA
jgi:hypothetical protein